MTAIVDGWFTGPGIIRKPLTVDKDRQPLTAVRRMNCHIAVTESSTLLRVFNAVGASDSHTYVRRGTAAQIADPNGMADMEQYVPVTMCANADWQGNDATVSAETQGGVGDDAENGQWDPAQVRRLRWMWKQVREEFKLPNKLVESSRLGSEENRGLGWHRIGIDGNFPSGQLGGRLQRGASTTQFQVWNTTLNKYTDSRFMHWTKHFGKSCPGSQRIKQMPSLLEEAPQLQEERDNDMAIYFVGDLAPDVFAFDTNSGTRRPVDSAEFDAVTAAGVDVVRVPQATLDALTTRK